MSRNFSLTNRTTYKLPAGFVKTANRLLQISAKLAKQSYSDISLVLVEAAEIRQLNKAYRRHDKVTDVLSFILEPKPLVGEVVICLKQAEQQAKRHEHSLANELAVLMTHGFLHLFGYDHIKLKDRLVMRPLEQAVLKLYEKK